MQRTVNLKQDTDRFHKAIPHPIFTGSETSLYFNQESHFVTHTDKMPSRMALMHTGIILMIISKKESRWYLDYFYFKVNSLFLSF